MVRLAVILLLCLPLSLFKAYGQTDTIGSGHALYFDGVDDYIDFGNIYDDLDFPFTISAWINVDPTATSGPIFVSQDNNAIYNGFWFVCSTNNFFIEYGDGRGENSSIYRRGKSAGGLSNIPGKWNHVCAVVVGSNSIELYINGVNVGGTYSGSSTFPMASVYPDDVARTATFLSNGITYRFKGMIDEMRIFDKALTQSEIREQMCAKLKGDEPNLIGYWSFDETSGTTVQDKSINGFDGQLMGNPSRVFSGAPLGDESTYTYTTDWSNVTLNMQENLSGVYVSDIKGNPHGLHIYKIKDIPSQQNGLSGSVTEPYFGVFLAADDNDNTFDLSYEFNGSTTCSMATRADNSTSTWTEGRSGLQDKVYRTEVIKIEEGNVLNIEIIGDPVICDQSSYDLVTNADPAGKSFSWNTGENSSYITVTKSDVYSVSIVDGCITYRDTIALNFLTTPSAEFLGSDRTFCENEILTLPMPSDVTEFLWQDGSMLSTFEVTHFGTYWVTVSNACGTASDSITFSESDLGFIPNVITPNGDSKNQYFTLDERFKGLVSIDVFNRWGKGVYSAPNYNNDWDGGSLQDGVYYYILSGSCIGQRKGTISIAR